MSLSEKISAAREIAQIPRIAQGDTWYNTLFVRHFSIYIAWLFVRIGISANTTTFFMILLGLVGVAMCVPHILWLNIMGVFLLMLAEVFDCVDGEIARWTKKSSLKGLYLDLVSHVLCNAPLSIMCGLHLYMLNRQFRYVILAFLAYATAQCRLGLSEVYYHVNAENSSGKQSTPKGSASPGSILQKGLYAIRMPINFSKCLLIILTDKITIQLISFVCIFLSYPSILSPMIFFAWFFVVSGTLGVIAAIADNYFFLVPYARHVKKV